MGGGGSSPAPKTPPFKPSAKMEEFVPADSVALQKQAIAGDRWAYGVSDKDFKARHGGVVKSEKLFEQSLLDDWQRKDTLSPALQAEMTRAGLASTAASIGDTTGAEIGTPGEMADAREASIARHLGTGILNYSQMQRGNRMGALQASSELFPRRTFGFGGEGFTNIALANLSGENNWNQAKYQNELSIEQANSNIQSQNAGTAAGQANADQAADAQKKAAAAAAGAAVAGALLIAL